MARDALSRAFQPTTPDDLLDPPRFGQPTETVKDVLAQELRNFFNSAQISAARRSEIPTIEKYSTSTSNDSLSTAVTIVRKLNDRPEAIPHVAVLASMATQRPLGVSGPFVCTVQDPSRLVTAPGPFALEDGDQLVINVKPDGRTSYKEVIVFTEGQFPTASPITDAEPSDVARIVNESSRYLYATVTEDDEVQIACRQSVQGQTPTELEVDVETSQNVLDELNVGRTGDLTDINLASGGETTLTAVSGTFSSTDVGKYLVIQDATKSYFNDGRFEILDYASGAVDTLTIKNKYGREEIGTPATFFVGERDSWTNSSRPPKHRYGMAFDISCEIQVLADDENTRGEITDLVLSFFSFFLESKLFTFNGRTGYSGQTVSNEFYQIVFNPPIRSSGENEVPRGNDASGKIHLTALQFDCTMSMYLDREVYYPGTTDPFIFTSENLVLDDTLPVRASYDADE